MRPRWIIVPVMQKGLVADTRLVPGDTNAYIHLLWHPPATIHAHSRMSGIPRETFRRSVKRMEQYDWVVIRRKNRGMVAIPWMPVEIEEKAVVALKQARSRVRFMGEWLMKCILDLIVHDHDLADNARPDWLVMGDGSGSLELDRWYMSAGVAFEFQGSQHYRIGPLAPTESDLKAQKMRDKIKAGVCNSQGIRLIQVRADDLNFQTMREKINGLLELVPIRENRPLFRFVDQLCRSYINYARRD